MKPNLIAAKRPLKGLRLPAKLGYLNKLVQLANFATPERIQALADARHAEDEASARAVDTGDRTPYLAANEKRFAVAAGIFIAAGCLLRRSGLSERLLMLELQSKVVLGDTENHRVILFESGSEVLEVASALQTTLRTVAQKLEIARQDGKEARFSVPLAAMPVPTFETRRGALHLDSDLTSHGLIPALEGLETWRLRICSACGVLYLAKRMNQLACGKTCGDTLYMRRYRERKAIYQKNRKRNRAAKLRRKEGN